MFLVNKVELDFNDLGQHSVSLLGPDAKKNHTHTTFIVGANGTSKSRMLAAVVEKFCELENERSETESLSRFSSTGAYSLHCKSISTIPAGPTSEKSKDISAKNGFGTPTLPSRILVLSNLVMDKFHFPRPGVEENPYYHYLGVRQATNLTTTGSLERSVSEAVLAMAGDPDRLSSFRSWTDLVFGTGRELAFAFPRLRRSEMVKLLEAKDQQSYVAERWARRIGSRRSGTINDEQIETITAKIVELFEFLHDKVVDYEIQSHTERRIREPVLRMATLTNGERTHLSALIPNFAAASRAGYSAWPTLSIEGFPWIPFNQLSSGEQNILSVGAKLIAHARPGCLIAIDEPEVSLNVAWQQHYTNLISISLAHAEGSHVLIATHSPHLISSVAPGHSSVVMIEKNARKLAFRTVSASFEGWGAESVLYQVLGIPSASSFHLNRDLAMVLRHIQDRGRDKALIARFLATASKLNYEGIEPLETVISEISTYLESMD